MCKNFKVNDLKSGYVVETRAGNRYIVTRVKQHGFDKVLVNKDTFINVNQYDEQLKCKGLDSECDIMKIWGLSDDPLEALYVSKVGCRPVLWERPKPKKMTIEAIEHILGYSIEII